MVVGSFLNAQEVRAFHSWMDKNDVLLACPICGYTDFTNHARIAVSSLDDVGEQLSETQSRAIQIECGNCGYKLQFGGTGAAKLFL